MSQQPPPGSAPRGPAPRGLHRRACVSGLGAGLGTRARASPPWERPQLSGALLGTLTQCSGDLVAAHQVWMSCWPAETSHIELAVRPPHPCGYKIGGNGKQRPTAPSLRAVASAADTSGHVPDLRIALHLARGRVLSSEDRRENHRNTGPWEGWETLFLKCGRRENVLVAHTQVW